MIAHQGGWDEVLLPALVVLTLVASTLWRRRRSAPTEAGRCEYCGEEIAGGQLRCPSCGFRGRA
jgi:hypothetical protein